MLVVKGCIHRQRPSKSIESHIITDTGAIAGFIDTITAATVAADAARGHSTITFSGSVGGWIIVNATCRIMMSVIFLLFMIEND